MGQKKLPNDPFALPFGYFPYSFPKRWKKPFGLCDNWCQVVQSANKNQNVSKWSSLDEIRVWQLSLFTYLFIENKKVSKDMDTNFILAILLSDRLLLKNPNSKTCQNKEYKRYQVHQTKDLEVLKSKGDIEVLTKDSDSLWNKRLW